MAQNQESKLGALIGIVVGLAAVAGFIVGPIMLASAFFHHNKIRNYRENGQEVQVYIQYKYMEQISRRNKNYYVDVGWWTAPKDDGGEWMTQEDMLLAYPTWKTLGLEDWVTGFYYPDKEKVMLERAMDPKYFAPMDKYPVGGITTGVGMGICFIAFGTARIRQKRKQQAQA